MPLLNRFNSSASLHSFLLCTSYHDRLIHTFTHRYVSKPHPFLASLFLTPLLTVTPLISLRRLDNFKNIHLLPKPRTYLSCLTIIHYARFYYSTMRTNFRLYRYIALLSHISQSTCNHSKSTLFVLSIFHPNSKIHSKVPK